VSEYDAIARLYDPWSVSVQEDVPFYLEEARAADGSVVELGVGTGRIAVPLASAGVHVIGVDSSRGMLAVCTERAELAGVGSNLDLRLGDLRDPPVSERVPLVLCPFRSFLHLRRDQDRRHALRAVQRMLKPGGRFIFDVFSPSPEDIADTHGRWIEREPGIWERADWDEQARTLTLSVRDANVASTMRLAWLSADEWQALLVDEGFEVVALYGWFDRTPYRGGEDFIFIASHSEPPAARAR
jgi:SAM-dependent methyltransferase